MGIKSRWRIYAPNPVNPKNHCFPVGIMSYAVWLYFRFTLSYRDV